MRRRSTFASVMIVLLATSSFAVTSKNDARKNERSLLGGAVDYVKRNWMPIAGTAVAIGYVLWLTRNNRAVAPAGAVPAVGVVAGAGPRINDLRNKFLSGLPSEQPGAKEPKPQTPVSSNAPYVDTALARREAAQEAAAQREESRMLAIATFIDLATQFRKSQLNKAAEEGINQQRELIVWHLLVDVAAQDGAIDEIVKLEEFWNLFVQDGHLIVAKISMNHFGLALQFLVNRERAIAQACLKSLRDNVVACFKELRNAQDGEGYSLLEKLERIGEAQQALGE